MMHSDQDETRIVRERFESAWLGLGVGELPDFETVRAHYAEPHRAYHDLEHIRACLVWLDACRALAEHPFEVALALIYHDVVYDPQRHDNEAQSAELFRRHARASHLSGASVDRIVALIEGTASHRSSGNDAALVNDIDLAVLGADEPEFDRYERQIRVEYQHVDEALFHVGRARVLETFLAAPSIYATPWFRQRLEAQARTNLARSLAMLQVLPTSSS